MRMLLKLATSEATPLAGARLGAAGAPLTLRRLFISGTAAARQGVAAAVPAAWYVAEAGTAAGFGASSAHPWDLAHSALRDGIGLAGTDILNVEPDLEQSWTWPGSETQGMAAAGQDRCQADAEKGAPFDTGGAFGWHLDYDHSDLRRAREWVGEAGSAITIVHLDTGYDGGHTALPVNLDHRREKNFVEAGQSAVDQTPATGLLKNRGHGTGTIGILAGGDANGLVSGLNIAPDFGPIGGAPLANIVPVRIANSVVHFWTSTVAEGIDYAREIGADVLSMSMGGLPSQAWADAVNAAYDAGVVLVCAAGNSFGGLPTSLIVYPARFRRVIAACGIMAKGHPYYGLGGPMEGNVGPASKMATAMAAYTPNIPWLRIGCPNVVDMDGVGTSAATPQVAAAAALWLAKNGNRFPARDWRRVEAVRAALFGSAVRPAADGADTDPYFGRGRLRARDALDTVPTEADLRRSDPDSASFAFLHLLSSVFGVAVADDPRRLDMFNIELAQVALNSRAARQAVPDTDLAPDAIDIQQRRRFVEAVLAEPTISIALRQHLEGLAGRGSVGGGKSANAQPTAETAWPNGADLPWRIPKPVPARRRLRVFATDPADGTRLDTAAINLATIEVPWEKLEAGPVGEYIAVIDVDPASDAAYEPVDLDSGALLAQDGHAPSEGNPQFHQQMVYAVAMRTIRNFEIALGRRMLWAERQISEPGQPFVPAPDGGYVQHLLLYPHALREKNAYYSPDKKALLFGYYADSGISAGQRTIFTCLSHDIVAHETTHALLDGLNRRYQENTNPDVLAFHEAFADIVAIFQHFTLPELLRFEIGRQRGNLWNPSMLSDLARQFGRSLHNERALRQAINPSEVPRPGTEPQDPLKSYALEKEPHNRGAILVAAVFEAFVAIYSRRVEDLFRIASGGSGLVGAGALHPDLVERLAQTATDTAQRVLTICIRALDYMPPVDPTFGDYLRAVVTADADLTPDRGISYRVAFAEAFARRGIYPPDITSVSPDSLVWRTPDGPVQSARLNDFIRTLQLGSYSQSDRRKAFESAKSNAAQLHEWLVQNLDAGMARSIGIDFRIQGANGRPRFEVHSVRPAQRTTDDGEARTDVIALITQARKIPYDDAHPDGPGILIRGGCTLVLDREYDTDPIRYAIVRPVWSRGGAGRRDEFGYGGQSVGPAVEPFAVLHQGLRPSNAHDGDGEA
nr:S8 family serine peptidase [uncultured Rhodopila sp.]